MESISPQYTLWQKIKDTIMISSPILMMLLYTLYFAIFYIRPELLEGVVILFGLKWFYPDFLFIPLVVGLYFYLYAFTYIINILINKYIFHSPHPATGLALPKKFHAIAIIFFHISVFVFSTLCLYVMSSISGCGLYFIDGQTPVGICLLTYFTSSITVTIVPLFIIIPIYFLSIRYLLRRLLGIRDENKIIEEIVE